MKNKENYEVILEYWFGDISNGLSPPEKNTLWYQSSEQTDTFIIKHFADIHCKASKGELDAWQQSSRSNLALIIILDQFSRNMFRGSQQAFAYDGRALDVCLQGLGNGLDKNLALIEKLFYYHPLMHAESIRCQEQCVHLLYGLLDGCNDQNRGKVENAIKFANEHRDIIAKFGRFPYRNAVLGRESSMAEIDYLNSGGKRFGQ